ncbi:MAG: photosystem reaction center subunit H [Clostridium butyricum]|nr:photosystem reaction center subunit H [Clostridium butyricum]
MLRSKDFYLKKVYASNGKKIGIVEDVCIDFFNEKLVGFKISTNNIFSKKNYVSKENVILIGANMIINEVEERTALCFKEIKDIEVIDTSGRIKGTVEDLIIDSENYDIKAIIVSSGLIDKMIKGKQIFLLNACILGEEYILYTKAEKVSFKVMPHNIKENYVTKKA